MAAEMWIHADLAIPIGGRTLQVRLEAGTPAVGIVGPSGAGKSTLLRVLAGVERRSTGSLRVLGSTWQDTATFVPPWERRVGWVPQDAALFPHLDVRGNLAYAGAAAGLEVGEVARMLGLGDLLKRAPRNLSGGERQRVALGRALVSRPRLLLLDEPFAALDRALRSSLATKVARWSTAHGVPVVLATHDERDLLPFHATRWEIADGCLRRVAELGAVP